jgi:hypothetical protein
MKPSYRKKKTANIFCPFGLVHLSSVGSASDDSEHLLQRRKERCPDKIPSTPHQSPKSYRPTDLYRRLLASPPEDTQRSRAPMAPEPEDDILNEKNPRPLDEDDIALLKTYVSATPVWISSPVLLDLEFFVMVRSRGVD